VCSGNARGATCSGSASGVKTHGQLKIQQEAQPMRVRLLASAREIENQACDLLESA
jgi:hypothetical protein